MKSRSRQYGIGIALILIVSALAQGQADDAMVLPQGRSPANLDFYRYHETTARYNAHGKREGLAYPFTHAALDSDVLTSLAPLDLHPLVAGKATLGDVAVRYRYDIEVLDLGYSYGLGEQLSIGIHVPYYWITNNVDTAFDNSSANVGLNPLDGECCIPVAVGGQPLKVDDVQELVTAEYGFSEIDSWSRDGIGDMGFNYASLEADTDSRQQIVIVAASYSTLPAYAAQQSRLPMEFSLAYRERFDGEGPSSGQANPVLYTRWLVAGMKTLF